jgi:hypothetical protein
MRLSGNAGDRRDSRREAGDMPPLWLRALLLAAALWLATRIVGNVTESLTGIFEGHRPPATTVSGHGP